MELAKINNNSPDAHSVSLPIPMGRGAYSLEDNTMETKEEMEKRIVEEIAASFAKKSTSGFGELKCKKCGEPGNPGEWPFSTAPATGLCDDCL